MTFLELCKVVKREIGISGSGPSSVNDQQGQIAQLVGFVQSADMLIQNLWTDWNFLWDEHEFQTVAEQEGYSPPNDFGDWDYESFYINWGSNESFPLKVLNEKKDLKMSGSRTLGTPLYLVVLPNNQLKLNPIPDKEYTLTCSYYKAPTMMTENTSVSAIPEQFHRIIIARAKMLYAEAEEIYDQMSVNEREYRETLAKLESHSLHGQKPHRYAQTDQLVVRPI